MKVVTEFPRRIRTIENAWIPMSDGSKLAARIWLPVDAESSPVPAVLEYIPYRKRDFTRRRDEPMHAYFAGHGYAAIRLDLRGSGDSDGLLFDEYLKQEHDDAVEAIAWIAAQPWCTGSVGMIGKSWGGFNALQIASRRPPALKAIITFCSTDDRYADDVHYMGGCQLAENLDWGSHFFAYLARPLDPDIVGGRWRQMWRERLENVVVPLHAWLTHQRRDAYWKHGSVCEDYGCITCAVYAITGWEDGYSNAVFRLVRHLKAPCKGLIGPWGHLYAHDGIPGPAIGFLQEGVRWWDHWLKGEDTGLMDEPKLRVWMQESVPPARDHRVRPGRWVAERSWPSPSFISRNYVLNPGTLDPQPTGEVQLAIRSPQTTGLGAPHWCLYGSGAESPGDQREDDGKSVVFDTEPLREPLEILGAPVVTLQLASDRPIAFVAVRLNDVMPDGASTRVTFGVLNLTHRDSHEAPESLEPGRRYRVRVQLNEIAHSFPAGHRLRLAISSCYWPMLWPAPEAATLSLYCGASLLELPERPSSEEDGRLRPFGAPESAAPTRIARLAEGHSVQTLEHDLTTGETVWHEVDEGGLFGGGCRRYRLEETGVHIDYVTDRRYAVRDGDPLSARAELREAMELGRGDWQVRIETRTRLSATKENFLLEAELNAHEGRDRIFERRWDYHIPRDLM